MKAIVNVKLNKNVIQEGKIKIELTDGEVEKMKRLSSKSKQDYLKAFASKYIRDYFDEMTLETTSQILFNKYDCLVGDVVIDDDRYPFKNNSIH